MGRLVVAASGSPWAPKLDHLVWPLSASKGQGRASNSLRRPRGVYERGDLNTDPGNRVSTSQMNCRSPQFLSVALATSPLGHASAFRTLNRPSSFNRLASESSPPLCDLGLRVDLRTKRRDQQHPPEFSDISTRAVGVTDLPAPSKSAAPGQYLGYSLQQVRLCHRLLGVPEDAAVSFEHLDDVAVHFSDGHILLEQSKSALRGKPASDRSTELWKAFANWADLCLYGLIDPATSMFRYYVGSPTVSGKLLPLMHAASTPDEVAGVLNKIKKLIDPKKPDVREQSADCKVFSRRRSNLREHYCAVSVQDGTRSN